MTQTTDNFIMLPTVDIYFKGLMNILEKLMVNWRS